LTYVLTAEELLLLLASEEHLRKRSVGKEFMAVYPKTHSMVWTLLGETSRPHQDIIQEGVRKSPCVIAYVIDIGCRD